MSNEEKLLQLENNLIAAQFHSREYNDSLEEFSNEYFIFLKEKEKYEEDVISDYVEYVFSKLKEKGIPRTFNADKGNLRDFLSGQLKNRSLDFKRKYSEEKYTDFTDEKFINESFAVRENLFDFDEEVDYLLLEFFDDVKPAKKSIHMAGIQCYEKISWKASSAGKIKDSIQKKSLAICFQDFLVVLKENENSINEANADFKRLRTNFEARLASIFNEIKKTEKNNSDSYELRKKKEALEENFEKLLNDYERKQIKAFFQPLIPECLEKITNYSIENIYQILRRYRDELCDAKIFKNVDAGFYDKLNDSIK